MIKRRPLLEIPLVVTKNSKLCAVLVKYLSKYHGLMMVPVKDKIIGIVFSLERIIFS
jgi:hypothetical protein